MYRLARSLLFLLNPETAHDVTMTVMSAGGRTGLVSKISQPVPDAPVRVMGLEFPNPVGLAAGLDKDGECIQAFDQLGFGFVEVGTVTPVGQPGNPKPRMFRLVENKALINRMGFNNKGVDHMVENLKKVKTKAVIGVNIGKNKETPLEQANNDYLDCLRKVYPWAGYVAVNLSSPNTSGLRELQFGDHLSSLLTALKSEQATLAEQHNRYVPIAIKLAPDVADDELRAIAGQIVDHGMDAIIATNTTVEREAVANHKYAAEPGGLSGLPLTHLATEKVRVIAEAVAGKIPVIGVGGIMTAADAIDKIRAGASLVQIYSGFIYRGPELVREISEAVSGELKRADRGAILTPPVVSEPAKAEEVKPEEPGIEEPKAEESETITVTVKSAQEKLEEETAAEK